MANKLMHIPNDDTQNYAFCRLQLVVETLDMDTLLIEPTNQTKIKVPKVVKPTFKKTLGTSVINSQISPPSLENLN